MECRPVGLAAGAGELVEVISLVTDDYPGCPGGRVLKH